MGWFSKKDRNKPQAPAPIVRSTEDLINELIAIERTAGALLAPRGSELRERIKSVGSALNDIGGMELMLEVHDVIRERLGRVRARELEAAWDGVGIWLG